MVKTDWVKEERERREKTWNKCHQDMKTAFAYYEQSNKIAAPSSLQTPPKHVKTARDLVDIGVQNYALDNPRAIVPPRARGEKAREQAGKLQTFDNAVLERIVMQLKNNAKLILLIGGAIFALWVDDYYFGLDKAKWDKKKLDALADRALTQFPLQVRTPNFINCYPSLAMQSNFQPVDMIESYNMSVAEAQYLCKRNKWKWELKPDQETVKWTAYYSNTERCFLMDDIAVLKGGVVQNILGFCPYVVIPSSYGQEDYEGRPEFKYRSIITPVQETIDMQEGMLSQLYSISSRLGWPKTDIEGDYDAIKTAGVKINTNPDEPQIIPEGVKITRQEGQVPDPALYAFYGQLQAQAGVPSALEGRSVAGVYSGTHQESLIGYEKTKYKDPYKNMEDGLGEFIGGMCRGAVEVLGNPVSVREFDIKNKIRGITTLEPSDIDGYHYSKIQFQAERPEATQMRKVAGMNAYKAGMISKQTAQTDYFDMSIEEAQQDFYQMLMEEMLKEPLMRQAMAVDVAEINKYDTYLELLKQVGGEAAKGGDRRMPAEFGLPSKQVPRTGERIEGAVHPIEEEALDIEMER